MSGNRAAIAGRGKPDGGGCISCSEALRKLWCQRLRGGASSGAAVGGSWQQRTARCNPQSCQNRPTLCAGVAAQPAERGERQLAASTTLSGDRCGAVH
jgi:hypothetical protein